MLKTALLCLAGTLCLVRGLHNSTRALVKRGQLRRCEGKNGFGVCDPSLEVITTAGESVFSVAPGKIVAVGRDFLHVLVRDEPVILMYQGVDTSLKRLGQSVSSGELLGKSTGTIYFSVTQMGPGGVSVVSPSAWLVSRGCSAVLKNEGNPSLWCAQGRTISIPQIDQRACNFQMPDRAGFSLLPVSVELQ